MIIQALTGKMDKLVNIIALSLCFVVFSVTSVNADDPSVSREYKIKAAYLYNLIKFVNWPSQVNHADSGITHICVYGNSPFEDHLNKLTTKKAKGRTIEISTIKAEQPIDSCNILFIPNAQDGSSQELSKILLHQIGNKPILTVGENNQFLDQGGLISLVVADNNVQLQIHLTKAKGIGFVISGNLLEIAKTVK